jgi:SH3 domain-containing YSC84-like protein 1
MWKKVFPFLVCFTFIANHCFGNELQDSINRATVIIENLEAIPEKSIPRNILRSAKGVAIINVIKAAFIVGGRGGVGLVVAKTSDGWSAPSAIGLGGAGIGFQAGAELINFVFVLNNQKAVDAFSHGGNFTLGADISVAAGPLGRTAEAGVMPVAAIYTYSQSEGLFAGVSVEGTIVGERKETNAEFYGRRVRAKELLSGKIARPKSAKELYRALNQAME